MDGMRDKIADGSVLRLLEQMLQAGVMDSARGWQPTEQGAVVSPLLSNIYLDGLDWQMAREGFEMVRYADDFIVLCSSQQQASRDLRASSPLGRRKRPELTSGQKRDWSMPVKREASTS